MPVKAQTMAEVEADRRRTFRSFWKGTPPVVAQRQKRATNKAADEAFRKAVWVRDGGLSRASGVPVVHGHVDNRKRGEVAHLTARSTNPGEKRDPRRGVLLTAEEHALSDARTAPGGKALLEVKGKDGSKRLRFVRRDERGRVLWSRESDPPAKARA